MQQEDKLKSLMASKDGLNAIKVVITKSFIPAHISENVITAKAYLQYLERVLDAEIAAVKGEKDGKKDSSQEEKA
jgi:hypothetical protein